MIIIFAGRGKWSKEEFVIKVEPHTNGPLFVELHFYCRATKKEDIEDFKKERDMRHLGIPDLKGCGSFLFRNKRLRFIAMPRYGEDLQMILERKEKSESGSRSAVEHKKKKTLSFANLYCR
mgnify:CR=1 FL=1